MAETPRAQNGKTLSRDIREVRGLVHDRDHYTPQGDKAAMLRRLDEWSARAETLESRAGTLEDAAFHFLTCDTCRLGDEDVCVDGRKFSAFMRGEAPHGR